MDLGSVGLDGLVSSETSSDPETKHKWYGSGYLKQERSINTSEEDELRSSKLAKTTTEAIMLRNTSSLRSNATLFSDAQHQQQMLSFSSPKSDSFLLDNKTTQNVTLPYAYHPFSSYTRNTGYSSGNMHGAFNGSRGPFTPSQWMELEHQALIYKYITANVSVPPHLLIPIRKALDSAGFSHFSHGLLRPNALGWGGFHLGYSNNTDPEPGRCRRTDGKKWRCSRDAVVDQKYCERHMNRGRHRSRKHVEGQSGHALNNSITTTTAAITTTTSTTNNTSSTIPSGSKQLLTPAAPSPSSTILVPAANNNASNNITFSHHDQSKNMHNLLSPENASAANTINRLFMNNKENNNSGERMQDASALPMLPPTLDLKPKENNSFMPHKQNIPYDESSRNNEFGFVTSDSLLNPSQKTSTLLNSNRTFVPSSSQNLANRDTTIPQHSLRHFMDDCPKTHNRSGGFSWPELSISTPITSSDFMSFTSSPNNEKLTLSPLKLSRELEIDPIQMGLGVGNGSTTNEPNTSTNNTNTNVVSSNTRQANWIPVTWENSMGGPLGEVLHLSSINYNASDHCANNNSNNSSALNLMTDGWDNHNHNHNSPPMGSSPTGVLQKTAFGSLSNSSAGSSPRAENIKTQEGASLCNDLLGSTSLGNASFTP